MVQFQDISYSRTNCCEFRTLYIITFFGSLPIIPIYFFTSCHQFHRKQTSDNLFVHDWKPYFHQSGKSPEFQLLCKIRTLFICILHICLPYFGNSLDITIVVILLRDGSQDFEKRNMISISYQLPPLTDSLNDLPTEPRDVTSSGFCTSDHLL